MRIFAPVARTVPSFECLVLTSATAVVVDAGLVLAGVDVAGVEALAGGELAAVVALVVLLLLIFSKFFYLASMSNYFTFFLIGKFHVTIQQSQLYLFVYLAAIAAGTLIGGFAGDRFGRKKLLLGSLAVFGAGSVLCAEASSPGVFLAARLMMGLAGSGVTST